MRALIALIVAAALVAVFLLTRGGEDESREPSVAPPRTEIPEVEDPTEQTDLDEAGEQENDRAVAEPTAVPENQVLATSATGRWGNALRGLVLDENGDPAADVRLTLTDHDPLGGLAGSAPERERVKKSGKDGTFAFENLDPDEEYTLVARHPEFGLRVESALQVPMNGSEEITIRLKAGARVHGQVSAGGLGLPEARIRLHLTVLAGDPAGTLETTTDAEGNYEFVHVIDGNYSIEAWKDGYGRVAVDNLNVSSAEPTRQDLTLQEAYLIQGTVQGTNGEPIERAIVEAYPAGRQTGPKGRSKVRTDEEGRFELNDIQQGTYTLTASASGFRGGRATSIQTGDLDVRIQLEPLPSISGRVLAPDGQPLKNFTVQLRVRMQNSDQTIAVPNQRFKVRDSEDGGYLVHATQDREYRVEAIHPEYAPSFSDFVQVTGPVRGIDVTMTEGGTIRGMVVDADGPVAGARVRTYDDQFVPGDAFFAGMGFPSQATETEALSNADGTFELEQLSPGTYQVYVTSADHADLDHHGIEIDEGTEVDVGRLVLPAGGTLTGRVVDAEGNPVAGAVIDANPDAQGEPGGKRQKSRTDSEGRYRLEHVPAGSYNVYASLQKAGDALSIGGGERAPARSVRVVEGGSVTADFTLPR